MNTTLSTPVDHQKNNHPPSRRTHGSTVRRVSLADRVALHLGLALITWSRRPRTLAPESSADDVWRRNERARERAAREAQWIQAVYLSQPRR
jgi:hypothetical protein